MGKRTFIIDLDDTLINYDTNESGNIKKYLKGRPNFKEIKLLKKLYKNGNYIIIHTGRGWDKYTFTKKQLKYFGIKYHELILGKPQGVYVDKDSIKSLEEFCPYKKK